VSFPRAVARVAAAVVLAGCVVVPVVVPAAAASGSCATSQLQQVPGGRAGLAGSVPVVFIHGIISSATMWKASTPRSMAYQAARLSGVTAWTFNYAQDSLDWVNDPAIGPAFAGSLACLARQSGHEVIVVAHSMGGLATQYALARPDPSGGTVGGHVAQVITVGTPYQGSELLTAMQLARLGVHIDPRDFELAALGDAVLSACAGHTSGMCALPAVLPAQVGTALELHSAAIAQLPSWPASLPVLDIAGDMGLVIPIGPSLYHRFDLGDIAVTVGSATAHNTTSTPIVKHCNSLTLLGAVHGDPGPCFHTHLVNDGDIITDVLSAIRQHVASAQPTRTVDVAPVLADGQPVAGERITDRGTAQCEAGSDSAGQAYRCFSQNVVYDPCWLDNADPSQATVLCQEQPWSTQITRFSIPAGGLEAFLGPPQPIDPGSPWGVQLSDGERCLAVQGTHDSFDGKVVDYACGANYDHVLLRSLDRSSSSWTYQSAYFDGTGYHPGPVEHVSIAWYANPDNGAAVDDRQDDCTATALAHAAQVYEAAHHDPDGALPEINAQACDAGYAEVVFTQTAPPGYTAAIALKASPSGWQEIGSADYIPPGQFGMPPSVGKTINKELASAPQTEQVAF